MPSPTTTTLAQLRRLVGTPACPILLDVRLDEDFALDPRMLPGSTRVSHSALAAGVGDWAGRNIVVICQKGRKLSEGSAAWLRHAGAQASVLEDGFAAWSAATAPLVNSALLPPRDAAGRTVWVTRARPKIDRIACPWLIRRFIDPSAVFLFVAPAEVADVAARFAATAFDIEGVTWSHRNDFCTFDVMLQEFGLEDPALADLARIIRSADTDVPELSAEAAGLLAISLGLSRMFRDDLAQLDAAMVVYDALYRWCRDAQDERHDWPAGRAA